jgi:periplasmic protein TonB
MRLHTVHWLLAGLFALALHAAIIVGWRSDFAGEAAARQGPQIEAAASLGGILGQPLEISEKAPEPIHEVEPEVVETREPVELAATAPVIVPDNIKALEAVPVAPVTEVEKSVPAPVLAPPPPKDFQFKQKKQKKAEPQKKRTKTGKKTTKARGSPKRGNAGSSKKSRAGSAAIASYGSQVRSRIASAARRAARGTGRLSVTVSISSSGGLSSARISRSSGNSSLDNAVLASVRGTSFPRPPSGMGSKSFSVSITFR